MNHFPSSQPLELINKKNPFLHTIDNWTSERHPNALNTRVFFQYWVSFSMSCGIWQSILTSCAEFSEWYPGSSVHMWRQDVLASWTELVTWYHIVPVLVHMVWWKLKHFCPWKEELQMAGIYTRAEKNNQELYSLVVPLGDTAVKEDRAWREREANVPPVSLNLHTESGLLSKSKMI